MEGKSACPVVSSSGMPVMKYLVRFIGSSRPGSQCGLPGRSIQANCSFCRSSALRVSGMTRKR